MTDEQLLTLWEKHRSRGLSRRNFVRLLTALGGLSLVMQFLAACIYGDEDDSPITPSSAPDSATPATSPSEPSSGDAPATQSSGPPVGLPNTGGEVTITFHQEAATLNYYYSGTIRDYYEMSLEGLIGISPEGEYFPLLLEDVPTVQNGLVSADGLQVTYTLRSGMLWDDGEPVTAGDIQFTWQALVNPENSVASTAGYDLIDAIEIEDDVTAVVRFRQVFPAFPVLFPQILPKHAFDGDLMSDAAYNREPLSSGAFSFSEWLAGDQMTWVRNTNFREESRPYLDTLVERFVPNREVAALQIKAGETDVVWDVDEAQLPELEALEGIELWNAPSPHVERLLLNLSNPRSDNPGDPNDPHPILGELEFRQALQLAIDKQRLVDSLLFGRTDVAVATLGLGWSVPDDLRASEYDPERAMELLEELGWVTGADNIRERDGMRCSLELITTSGNQLREQQLVLLQEMLRETGIELVINTVPGPELFGSWSDGAATYRGTFDIAMYTRLGGIDPHIHCYHAFHSSQIPSEANDGNGNNFYRLIDAEIDATLDEAGSTMDETQRRELYGRMFHRVNELIPEIYLYRRPMISAFRSDIKGWQPNSWMGITWDAKNWYREV